MDFILKIFFKFQLEFLKTKSIENINMKIL